MNTSDSNNTPKPTALDALCQRLDIPTTHWVCGAGQFGCLYDYGPERSQTKEEAIDALESALELNDRERKWLEQDERATFTGERREEVGHAYCEISEEPGPVDNDYNEVEEVEDGCYGYGSAFEANGETYVVMTGDELDLAVDAAVDSYIEDCIFPELSEIGQRYFDSDAFKRDVSFAGEGESMLSGYDGCVHEELVGDTWFHIVRIA